ncbi:1,6-anhydro-N-acetylmuramyl-L-alanine amidase AmpD [Hydrogenophaga sp.]|uniref:1,6-anhydro-N-acetylmuramyl-L-alanine amidase AmpD n=1 Tax=Hydrogenophaga sp. TaxID=1904254 RepID=UPI003F70DE89
MTTPPDTSRIDGRTGWFEGARHCPSVNHGPRPHGAHIDLIVIHSISLPPGEYGGPEVEQLFTNALDWTAHPYFEQIRGMEVSAHFFIRRDGELVQFVDVDARAWHAGASQWNGRENRNDDSIGIELEGLEGDTFEPAQYQTLAKLCTELARRYPVSQVAGHEHIAPQRKQDPGPGFEWTRLRRELGWAHACFPECAPGDERTTPPA